MTAFRSAGVVHTGRGSLQQLGVETKRLGARRVLLLTDPGVKTAGLADLGREVLIQAGIEADIFDGVQPEPTLQSVERCFAFAKAGRYDLFVGLGGGSSLDTAKAVSVLMTNPGRMQDYLGVDLLKVPGLPKIAVPTTAGTGSEVTPVAVFTDTAGQMKIGMVSPYLIPDVAIVDPELTIGLPFSVTAATGMDALTHAVEAYTSLRANPISDAFALQAIAFIARSLRTAVHNGTDMGARTDMAVGSLLAGLAFANASVTATHALAFALGGQFNISHGVANAVMLPHVMEFNCVANLPRFARIARLLGEPVTGCSLREAAARVAEAIRQLSLDVGIPQRLRDLGIPESAVSGLAQRAISVTRIIVNNPRRITLEDVEALLLKAW